MCTPEKKITMKRLTILGEQNSNMERFTKSVGILTKIYNVKKKKSVSFVFIKLTQQIPVFWG